MHAVPGLGTAYLLFWGIRAIIARKNDKILKFLSRCAIFLIVGGVARRIMTFSCNELWQLLMAAALNCGFDDIAEIGKGGE